MPIYIIERYNNGWKPLETIRMIYFLSLEEAQEYFEEEGCSKEECKDDYRITEYVRG